MTKETILKLAFVMAIPFAARAAAGWRTSKRERIAHQTPLFDAAQLEAALEPRVSSDDRDVLVELKVTFTKLNRQAYAEELWDLPSQLQIYYFGLSETGKGTVARALVRMIETSDSWLQLVAARTASNVELRSAAPAIRRTIDKHIMDAERNDTEVNDQFVREMDSCVAVLDDGADKSSGSR